MSEYPIPEVITPDQDVIWRKRLDEATGYSIKLQRLIESLKREDTPYQELHHHKMIISVKERIARLESENRQLREALEKATSGIKSEDPSDWPDWAKSRDMARAAIAQAKEKQ